MKKAKDYLTFRGWKADLDETRRDLKDIRILVRRAFRLLHYGFKNGGEMTSKEPEYDDTLKVINQNMYRDREGKYNSLTDTLLEELERERRYREGKYNSLTDTLLEELERERRYREGKYNSLTDTLMQAAEALFQRSP